MVINNPNYYNEIASGYDELHADEQIRKIEVCMKHIAPQEQEKILDVGCGSGVSTAIWKCERYGIDPSEKLVDIAKEKRDGPQYIVASAENIPFEDDMFDYVISITAIQNFDDIQKGLKEMRRVLKENGNIIISTLKDSPRIKEMQKEIESTFSVDKIVEDKIDIFFIGSK